VFLLLSQLLGCASPVQKQVPSVVLDDLGSEYRAIMNLFERRWWGVDSAEFGSLREPNLHPTEQTVIGSLVLSVARIVLENRKPLPLRSYLIGETDEPQLYQLMERNFVRHRRLKVTGIPSKLAYKHIVELFTVSVAFCLNGVLNGSGSCIRDFQALLVNGNHFKFGQSTKFIITDDNWQSESSISDQVRAWIHRVIKPDKDSVVAVRIARTSILCHTTKPDIARSISFDHPVTVYMHFPN